MLTQDVPDDSGIARGSRLQVAKDKIAARAGVKRGQVAIYFSTYDDCPPTLQRVDRYGKPIAAPGGIRPIGRRVLVGRNWLRNNAPELWAVFVAARLVDGFHPITQAPRSK